MSLSVLGMSFGKLWCTGHVLSSVGSEEQSLSGEGSSCHQEFLTLALEELSVMRFVLSKLVAQSCPHHTGRELGSSA